MVRIILILTILTLSYVCSSQTIEELKKQISEKDLEIKTQQEELSVLNESNSNNTKFIDAVSTLSSRLNRDFDGDKKERVQLGLSFAYGELSKNDKDRFRLPTIMPLDSTLRYQRLDGRFVLVSTTMTVTPFLYSDWIKKVRSSLSVNSKGRKIKYFGLWLIENSGFSVNINFFGDCYRRKSAIVQSNS